MRYIDKTFFRYVFNARLMSESKQELAATVALLRRKIVREKKARSQAEEQLEVYSRELYEVNRSLKRSLTMSRKNEAELAFLKAASIESTSYFNLPAFARKSLELIAKFTDSTAGMFTIDDRPSFSVMENMDVWKKYSGWTSDNQFVQILKQEVIPNFDAKTEQWSIVASKYYSNANIYYINFQPIKDKFVTLVILNELKDVEEVMLSLEAMKTNTSQALTDVAHNGVSTSDIPLFDSQNIEAMHEYLLQKDKMSSLGQLAAGVAHELNNPLGYITSNMQVLGEYIDDFKEKITAYDELKNDRDLEFLFEDSHDIVDSSLDGLMKMAEIIKGLKNFSYSPSQEFTPFNLNDVVNTALKVLNNELKHDYHLDIDLYANVPEIIGNPGQIQQVLINVIMNAKQAMPDGGDIMITTKYDNNYVSVAIKDSGDGIAQHIKEKLFTPFFTTKEVGQGTGLGLSISHSIMEGHRGQIAVDSTPGEGATFTLMFPVTNT